MINRVPEELKVEFIKRHPSAKVLEYKETDYELFNTKIIYWKDDNLLGIYSLISSNSTNYECIDDNFMTTWDMEKLIELSKLF